MWQVPFDVTALSLSSETRCHMPSFFLLSGGDLRRVVRLAAEALPPWNVKTSAGNCVDDGRNHVNDIGILKTFKRASNAPKKTESDTRM